MDSADNSRGRAEPIRFHEAVFLTTATDPSDTLMVRIPDFSADEPFGDPDGVVWSPMGGVLPEAGDRALVAESTDGTWWVLAWWSDSQDTSATATGLDARLAVLEAGPEALRLVGAGGQPAFQNSWANFDAVRPLTFYRHQGRTHLQGIIKSGTVGATIFTLPSGYAPVNADASNPLTFPVDSNAAYGRLFIYGTGAVVLGAGSNVYCNVNGISFRHA